MLNNTELKEIAEGLIHGTLKHVFYEKSVALAKEISRTFSKDYPEWMDKDRPKEPKRIKEYRKTVFQNPVIGEAVRITDKYIKIEQADGFSVSYPKETNEQNELEQYCDNGFFGYNSLVNYVFTSVISKLNYDPNAVVAVFDKAPSELETEARKPFPYIFKSEQVKEYVNNSYCAVEEEGREAGQRRFYVFDDVNYYIIDELKTGKLDITVVAHNCGQIPAFKIGQFIEEEKQGERLLRSILHDTIPHFRSAIRRYNDIEVELIHHINTKEWSIAPEKCKTCNGQKKVGREQKKCGSCEGTGVTNWNVLEELLIERDSKGNLFGEGGFPFSSPAGYVPRSVEALKAMQVSYIGHIDEGYNAIDFGILRQRRTSAAESAKSKQMERLEYSQKIYSAARHVVENLLIQLYRFIDAQLFGVNPNQIGKRLPQITTPMEFDLMSPEALLEELKLAIDAEMNEEIKSALKIKYAKLVVGENARETKTLIDQVNIDPLFGKTVEELELLMGGGEESATSVLDRLDVIMSANFKGLIDKAMRENPNWDTLEETKKYEIIRAYAQEILDRKIQAQKVLNTIDSLREKAEVEETGEVEKIEQAA